MQEAEAVEFLLKSYPDYVTVESLPLENLQKQVRLKITCKYMMSMMMMTNINLTAAALHTASYKAVCINVLNCRHRRSALAELN